MTELYMKASIESNSNEEESLKTPKKSNSSNKVVEDLLDIEKVQELKESVPKLCPHLDSEVCQGTEFLQCDECKGNSPSEQPAEPVIPVTMTRNQQRRARRPLRRLQAIDE